MKRIFFILALIFNTCFAFAQTQQGIVKTRGRMVNGQLVAGQRLTGATVTLSIGNPLVSGKNGAFSFNVPSGKNYSLVTATKQGYTLADPEYTRRSFVYSSKNPFYVVLEDEAQRQADINAATRKVRRTLTAQLQAREDEIETLKEQNKLTEAEYQRRLQELYDNQSKSEQLVKEMAERYASTDYDQLDEFNQQVQMYIEEGELQKADSMIRSKGDMEKRIEEYHSVVAANKKVREELEQSESGAAKTYEDLSQDLFNKHTIAMQQCQWDEALLYLKQRADLDTTNTAAVFEYAYLCLYQRVYDECEAYLSICLNAYMQREDLCNTVLALQNFGVMYIMLHDFDKAEQCIDGALQICEKSYKQNQEVCLPIIADLQTNLGTLYDERKDYTKSTLYLNKALDNYSVLSEGNPNLYKESIAKVQNNLGLLYINTFDYLKAEKNLKSSLENYEQLFQNDAETYRAGMARTLQNLALLYSRIENFKLGEKYGLLALEHYEVLYKYSPASFLFELSNVQGVLGIIYRNLADYSKSEKYLKLALKNREMLYKQNPETYRYYIAQTQNNMGNLYKDTHNYSQSIVYFLLSLSNYLTLCQQSPDVYRSDLAAVEMNVGNVYYLMKDYSNSIQYLNTAIETYDYLCKENPDNEQYKIIRVYTLSILVDVYVGNKNYDEALKTLDRLILLNPVAFVCNLKGEILLIQDRKDEALAMWKKVLELNPDFLKDYPDGTNLSNGLKKLGLIE